MTSAHLSSGSEAFFSLLLFQERIWQPSKGHLLLCCSLQSHQSGAKALLSIPLEAFPLQRFFTSGNVQLCQPLCCPPQNMFQSLSYSGKTFGIIFWLLTGILQAPVGTSGSPFLFQLFFIHSPITQRCQGKGGGKQLLLSSGSQCWSCLWQWQCCEGCAPGTREERCRGCASNFSLYRGHTPPGKQPPPAWQGLLAGGCRNCSSD